MMPYFTGKTAHGATPSLAPNCYHPAYAARPRRLRLSASPPPIRNPQSETQNSNSLPITLCHAKSLPSDLQPQVSSLIPQGSTPRSLPSVPTIFKNGSPRATAPAHHLSARTRPWSSTSSSAFRASPHARPTLAQCLRRVAAAHPASSTGMRSAASTFTPTHASHVRTSTREEL